MTGGAFLRSGADGDDCARASYPLYFSSHYSQNCARCSTAAYRGLAYGGWAFIFARELPSVIER